MHIAILDTYSYSYPAMSALTLYTRPSNTYLPGPGHDCALYTYRPELPLYG